MINGSLKILYYDSIKSFTQEDEKEVQPCRLELILYKLGGGVIYISNIYLSNYVLKRYVDTLKCTYVIKSLIELKFTFCFFSLRKKPKNNIYYLIIILFMIYFSLNFGGKMLQFFCAVFSNS